MSTPPDAALHNPDPVYLRTLVRRTGLSQSAVADRIKLPLRTLQAYLSEASSLRADYRTQYALERLVEELESKRPDQEAAACSR